MRPWWLKHLGAWAYTHPLGRAASNTSSHAPEEYPCATMTFSTDADGGANDDWIKNVSMGKKLFIKRIRDLAID